MTNYTAWGPALKTIAMISAAVLLLAAAGFAQMEVPKPGPEHKKLAVFTGSWTLDGDMKASPMGPAGKVLETEKCEWMEGNFYVVCHVQFTSKVMGNGAGISVMGYSNDDKAYTYREFNSWGEFTDAKGTLEGDKWAWTNDQKMGGMTSKGRFTMKMTSPTSYDFSYEISQDGTQWTTIMDGKATKNQ
jgi:hypothetical protein